MHNMQGAPKPMSMWIWGLRVEGLSYLPSTMYNKASKEHNKQMMSEPKCLKV